MCIFMEIRSENVEYQPTEFQIHNEIILLIIFHAKSASWEISFILLHSILLLTAPNCNETGNRSYFLCPTSWRQELR